jgi:rhodanese-related sulfurtransferase
VLDVRTTAETRVVAMTGARHIPLDVLMRKESLDRLPTDGRIIVVCHSGNRAAAATAPLGAVRFTNASYVNGGLIALTTATAPKAVPIE